MTFHIVIPPPLCPLPLGEGKDGLFARSSFLTAEIDRGIGVMRKKNI